MEAIKRGGRQFEWTKAGNGQNKSRKKSCVAVAAIQCQLSRNSKLQAPTTENTDGALVEQDDQTDEVSPNHE